MDLFDKIIGLVEEESLEKLNKEIERTKEELKKLSLIKKIKEDRKAYYRYRINKHKETIKDFLLSSPIKPIFEEYKSINIKIDGEQIKVSFKIKPEIKQILKGGMYEKPKSTKRVSRIQPSTNQEQTARNVEGIQKDT